MNGYVKIFNGYRHAYGIADWTNATVDPESGKKKPDYRWTYEEFTDQIYQDHLTGENLLVHSLQMKTVMLSLVLLILTLKITKALTNNFI